MTGRRQGGPMAFDRLFSRGLWRGIFRRLREILLDAPWSSFDLIAALVIGLLGFYFLLPFDAYALYPTYATLGTLAGEQTIGSLFLLTGVQALAVVIYCEKPPLGARLCARVAMAICFLIMLGNTVARAPPPPSLVLWGVLFAASLLGVLRTRQHGH